MSSIILFVAAMVHLLQSSKGENALKHKIGAITVKFCVIERGPEVDRYFKVRYSDKIGRRLPMSTFRELVLNETSGKYSNNTPLYTVSQITGH